MRVLASDTSFKSTNINVRKVDQVSRSVRRVFPVVSSTRIETYSTLKDSFVSRKIYSGLNKKIDDFRYYSQPIFIKPDVFVAKLLNIMSKEKVGNCLEQAIATTTTLQVNGYKDATTCLLYAYNKQSKSFRSLEHAVSVIGLSSKKNTGFGEKELNDVFIKPNNKSIIVDTWAGYSGFAKNSSVKYRGEVPIQKPLGENEELAFVISPYHVNVPKKLDKYLAYKYPELFLHENRKKSVLGFLHSKFEYRTPQKRMGVEYEQDRYCF